MSGTSAGVAERTEAWLSTVLQTAVLSFFTAWRVVRLLPWHLASKKEETETARSLKVRAKKTQKVIFSHFAGHKSQGQTRFDGRGTWFSPLDGEAAHTFIIGEDRLHLWRWLITGIICNPVNTLKVTLELSNSHWSILNLIDHQNSLISSERSRLYHISSFVPGAWKKCQWGWQKYTHRYWASLAEMQNIPGHS